MYTTAVGETLRRDVTSCPAALAETPQLWLVRPAFSGLASMLRWLNPVLRLPGPLSDGL